MPTRSPVNGPGPQPTTTAVRSVTVEPGVGERGQHVRGELLGVCAGVDGHPFGEHLDAVTVAPHDARGDGGRRGVDGEDDRSSLAGSTARSRSALRCPAPRSSRMSRWLLREPLGEALAPLHDDDGVVEIGVEVQRVEFGEQVDSRRGRAAGTCRRGPSRGTRRGARGARGPTRTSATSPARRHPSPRAIPLASTVFPAPSGPDSTTTSPARNCPPSWAPSAMVSSAVGSSAVPEPTLSHGVRARSRTRRVIATSLDGVARSTSRTSASSMISGCSSCTRCPAPPTITSSDFGSAAAIALRVLRGREQVAVAAGDQRRHLRQRRQRRGLVVHLQRVQELRPAWRSACRASSSRRTPRRSG